MSELHSDSVEKKVLSLLFKSPLHMRALSFDDDSFAIKENKDLAGIIKKYVSKYIACPTSDSIRNFAKDLVGNDSNIDEVSNALMVLEQLPESKNEEGSYYFEKLNNYRIGRDIFDMAGYIKDKFDHHEKDFKKLRQDILSKLLLFSETTGAIKRGFVHENVKERWEQYKKRESGEKIDDLVPFGMKRLDDVLGGMRKTFLCLLYSKTGGGKTRTSINIAYNAAQAGYNVIYFTLEMAFDLIASCIDSRLAWVDSNHIIFGKLNKEDKIKYNSALKDQLKNKFNVWLVDIPMGSKSTHILEEIEIYRAMNGVNPDLVVVDYANLLKPMESYQGRSEKYDNLFRELHEIARHFNVAMVTATQESRDASKADKKKKNEDEDTEGVDNIGLSNYIAVHCETVIRLKQDKYDKLQNRLLAVIDKNRYGKSTEIVKLISLWDKTYVGDEIIKNASIKIQKE